MEQTELTEHINELRQQILDLIECMYSRQFVKRLDIKIDDFPDREEKAYVVKMYLHDQIWSPLVIAGEFKTDDEFLLFMYEELRSRNLIRSERYKIQLHGNN